MARKSHQGESWIERQQRMVKCRRHGLHYDPKLASGCYLCLKEAAKRRRPTPPKFLVLLLCGLGVALILFRIFGMRQDGAEGPSVSAASPPTVVEKPIDPEPLRRELIAFEEALFQTTPRTRDELDAVRTRLATTGASLRDALAQRHAGTVAEVSLDELVAAVPRHLSFEHLEQLRERWLRLRRRHLASAPWLAEGGATESASLRQRASEAQYRSVAFELVGLLQEASAEAAAQSTNPDPAAWRSFIGDWRTRLQGIAEGGLRRPRTDASPNVMLGFDHLGKAFDQALALASSPNPPRNAEGFQRALELAERSQQAFDEG